VIYIYNKNTLTDQNIYLDNFRRLYEDAFPEPNEREEFSIILQRIAEKPIDDNPHTFIIRAYDERENSRQVTGGIIPDWYEGSPSIHLTYIVVAPEARGKKISNTLILIMEF
jgi:hypothetical protein